MKKLIEKTREMWEETFDKIPRKIQVAVNVLLILFFGLLLYILLDAPAFSLEHAFRRMEKRHMVGPSQILGIEQMETTFADQLVVAKTEKGVILCVDAESMVDHGFSYREMDQDIKVCIAPIFLSSIRPPNGDDLTVILFDNYPEAVRAELDIETFWEDNQTGKQYRYRYFLSGVRTNPGYIRMDYDIQWHDYQGVWDHPENEAMQELVHRTVNAHLPAPAGEFPATVRLYDESGELICNRDIFLFPQAEEPADVPEESTGLVIPPIESDQS